MGVRGVQYLAGSGWEFLRCQDVFQSYISDVTDRKVLIIKNVYIFEQLFLGPIFCLFVYI